jgi:hypothetical protein
MPQTAVPPVRLRGFADLFPDRAYGGSICQQNLSSEVEAIGQLALRTVGSPCVFAELTDVDPLADGLQEDCIVEDVVGSDVVGVIPKCGQPPCWTLVQDMIKCPADDNLKLVVNRVGGTPPNAVARLRCRVGDL